MEKEIIAGKGIKECADEMAGIANINGITGFMYGCAVAILSEVWEYGEELRQWHNIKEQIGKEGEEANKEGTVLNPAILNLKMRN